MRELRGRDSVLSGVFREIRVSATGMKQNEKLHRIGRRYGGDALVASKIACVECENVGYAVGEHQRGYTGIVRLLADDRVPVATILPSIRHIGRFGNDVNILAAVRCSCRPGFREGVKPVDELSGEWRHSQNSINTWAHIHGSSSAWPATSTAVRCIRSDPELSACAHLKKHIGIDEISHSPRGGWYILLSSQGLQRDIGALDSRAAKRLTAAIRRSISSAESFGSGMWNSTSKRLIYRQVHRLIRDDGLAVKMRSNNN